MGELRASVQTCYNTHSVLKAAGLTVEKVLFHGRSTSSSSRSSSSSSSTSTSRAGDWVETVQAAEAAVGRTLLALVQVVTDLGSSNIGWYTEPHKQPNFLLSPFLTRRSPGIDFAQSGCAFSVLEMYESLTGWGFKKMPEPYQVSLWRQS
jgi:hypothetical protein